MDREHKERINGAIAEIDQKVQKLLAEKSALEAELTAPEEDEAYIGRYYKCGSGVFAITCLDYTYPGAKLCGPGVFYSEANGVMATKVTEGFHTSPKQMQAMYCSEIAEDEFFRIQDAMVSAAVEYMKSQCARRPVDNRETARMCNRGGMAAALAGERLADATV